MFHLHYDRLLVEHGPVPPHERSWRHPSEVAADETAELRAIEVPRSTRTFALATGTLGLVAIAVFVLAMTPSRDGTPIALTATTTIQVTAAGESAPTFAAVRGPVTEVTPMRAALATPIGRGDYAVVIRTSVRSDGDDTVQVALPSGRVVTGQIIDVDADTAVIQLAEAEPGHRIAEQRPHDRETVTVLATPPITVAFADIDELSVDEGTAVLDVDGELVGLCTRGANGTEVVSVDEAIEEMDAPVDAEHEHEHGDDGEPGDPNVTAVVDGDHELDDALHVPGERDDDDDSVAEHDVPLDTDVVDTDVVDTAGEQDD
ncbi:MAG: hypothetical protein CL424_08090 [Acidimicrobiaceae bacterium]|nr:hypothetical protein [Acidimicrobiaceae bacterium]